MADALQNLLDCVDGDKHLPTLRKRLDRADGSEAFVILPEMWPSIKAILALSDLAAERLAPQKCGEP